MVSFYLARNADVVETEKFVKHALLCNTSIECGCREHCNAGGRDVAVICSWWLQMSWIHRRSLKRLDCVELRVASLKSLMGEIASGIRFHVLCKCLSQLQMAALLSASELLN